MHTKILILLVSLLLACTVICAVPEKVCGTCTFGRKIKRINADPVPAGSIFDELVYHVGVFVHSERELLNQKNAYERVGIMFSFAGNTTVVSEYCGKNVTIELTVYLGQMSTDNRAFHELSWIRSNDLDMYNDLYDFRGPGVAYSALRTKAGVTRAQMLNTLAEKDFELAFSYSFPLGPGITGYADFVRIGYVHTEIITIEFA